MKPNFLHLGATLYMPATRADLAMVANGERLPFLKSVVLCTEDSIRPRQVEAALETLRLGLNQIRSDGTEDKAPLVFIRPRTPEVLSRILNMPGVERIDGFVLPKITLGSIDAFAGQIPGDFLLMPTLETREVFDAGAMVALRERFSAPDLRQRVLALRIGGNDILNFLGVRRRPGRTLYDTVAGAVVASLVATFKPFGFPMTAPVFEDFGDLDTLREEVSRDLDHGLVGKTAIHPCQIEPIEQAYRVPARDLEAARRILDPDAQAVFQVDRVMCEPATHTTWAQAMLDQAAIYGTAPPGADPAAVVEAPFRRRQALS